MTTAQQEYDPGAAAAAPSGGADVSIIGSSMPTIELQLLLDLWS